MSSAVVRRAEPRDIDAAVELFRILDEVQRPWRVFPPRRAIVDEARGRYERGLIDPDVAHVVAEVGDRLVGMAYGHVVASSSISDDLAVEVSNVVVRPEYRGRSIGRALVEAMVAFARERGVRWLFVKTYSDNAGSLRFWESLGFRARYVQLAAAVDEIDTSSGASE